jgi:hypothetical protein
VVGDRDQRVEARAGGGAEHATSIAALGAILDGVVDEVLEHLVELVAVAR